MSDTFHGIMEPGELGPMMQALTGHQRRFVWAYLLNGGNGAEAARAAGYSDKAEGAKVRAHELLQIERVIAAMHEVAWKTMRGMVVPATTALAALLAKPNHPDHAKAINMVLSRIGYSERTAHDVLVKHEVVNHTHEAIQQLRVLKGLGVPREKLLEAFGFSGLDRYERLLADEDAKRLGGPVLEHDAAEVVEVGREDDATENRDSA